MVKDACELAIHSLSIKSADSIPCMIESERVTAQAHKHDCS